jgi:hypothetical protein
MTNYECMTTKSNDKSSKSALAGQFNINWGHKLEIKKRKHAMSCLLLVKHGPFS